MTRSSDASQDSENGVPEQDPIGWDAFCAACGYNLRGLSGDPVRCPECGAQNPRWRLQAPHDRHDPRVRHLDTALDVCTLAVLLIVAGVPLVLILPVCALISVLSAPLGLILGLMGLSDVRSLCVPRSPALAVTRRYLEWTSARLLFAPCVWVAASACLWLVDHLVRGVRFGLVHVAAGALALVLLLIVYHPFPEFRRRQRAAYVELLGLLR